MLKQQDVQHTIPTSFLSITLLSLLHSESCQIASSRLPVLCIHVHTLCVLWSEILIYIPSHDSHIGSYACKRLHIQHTHLITYALHCTVYPTMCLPVFFIILFHSCCRDNCLPTYISCPLLGERRRARVSPTCVCREIHVFSHTGNLFCGYEV